MALKIMRTVRKFATERLDKCFVRLLHKRPVKIYVADIGLVFDVCYETLNDYDGRYVFMMSVDDEMILCKTTLAGRVFKTGHYSYIAKEVPFSFSRIPTRKLIVHNEQIIGHLVLCSKKS